MQSVWLPITAGRVPAPEHPEATFRGRAPIHALSSDRYGPCASRASFQRRSASEAGLWGNCMNKYYAWTSITI